jgi:hypothetical protein
MDAAGGKSNIHAIADCNTRHGRDSTLVYEWRVGRKVRIRTLGFGLSEKLEEPSPKTPLLSSSYVTGSHNFEARYMYV